MYIVMAIFKVEYRYYVGDVVDFEVCDVLHRGVIQSVHDIPDVWIECTDDGTYRRYRIGINSIKKVWWSEHDDYGVRYESSWGDDEHIEFVHKGDFGTKEYDEIKYLEK